MRSCESRGWIYVAQDLAVRHNPAELKTLREAKIHAIFFHGRRRTAAWKIENLKASHRRLVELIVNSTEPMHLVLLAGGRVERLAETGR